MKITKPASAKDRIVLALDVDNINTAKDIVTELKDYVGFFKVGLQLLTSCGFEAIKMVKETGGKVYCDLKFHDIPNTVAHACANLVKRNIDFFNIHLQGGSKMVSQVVKAAKETSKDLNTEPPTILGVSLLSSFGQRTLTQELCVDKNIEEYIMQLALMAKETGLDGIVASAAEARKIRNELGDDFIIMCSATRPTWAAVNDQVRVDTPTEAINAGVDYLVIGRPVTEAPDRIAAVNLIIDEINTALNEQVILGGR
ncbi:MAG TPA: orotidine-5'-phosphate decarboxylase [Candidatus Gastranaerophilaceae bacterium]|nr:orotidine-5'-phosphate decarboxylase [Candidatus Gastranaerophilaceae bacterium]